MLEKNFLFEYPGILGFDVGQSRGNCALVPFKVVVAHFKFTELELEFLGLLPDCIQFTLQRGGCCVVGGLKGHELGLGQKFRTCCWGRTMTNLPFVPLGFDARNLDL